MTLVEVLVASLMSIVLMLAVFAFLEGVTKSSANDQERSSTLTDTTQAVHAMAQELGEAYEYGAPVLVAEKETEKSNYVEVKAMITTTAASQVRKRLVFDCEEESPQFSGEKECVRYEAPTTDATEVKALSKDSSAARRVVIAQVVNSSSEKVFELKTERGGTTPSYGEIFIETPAAGGRVDVKNNHDYSYDITLRNAFYLRNLEFKT